MKILFTTSLVFSFLFSFAQNISILEKKCNLEITQSNDKIQIDEQNYQSKQFVNNYNQRTTESIYYYSFDPIKNIKAYTKIPTNNGDYKIQKVKVFETKDVYQSGIFYHDQKKNEFIYPAVIPNSIGVLEYNKIITDPHFINPFYFNDNYDVNKSCYSISAPTSVKIDYSLFNINSSELKFTVDTIKNIVNYKWEMQNLKKFTSDPKSPSIAYSAPHIIVRIYSYKYQNTDINVSRNIDDLFQWYNSLLKNIPACNNDEEITLKVKELTQDLKTDTEKIKSIYKWIQSNIKYIAFEDGLGGFVPRAAGDVYTKKYGDCKDKANLLKTMVEKAGIPAYFTWVGTSKKKPYTYGETPSISVDNHMICTVKLNDSLKILDPTNEYAKFQSLPRSEQGKEALVKISENEYKIIKIPITNSEENLRIDSIKLKLNDEVFEGKITSKLSGYNIENYHYKELSAKISKKTNFIQDYLSIGKNSSLYSNSQIEETENDISIKFNANFKNDVIISGDKIYVNLNLDPSENDMKISDLDKRISPIFEDYKDKYLMVCELEIPQNYKIEYLPENSNYYFDNFNLKTNYIVSDNKIIYSKEIINDFMLLNKEKFNDYKSFIEGKLKTNEQKIIFKKL